MTLEARSSTTRISALLNLVVLGLVHKYIRTRYYSAVDCTHIWYSVRMPRYIYSTFLLHVSVCQRRA